MVAIKKTTKEFDKKTNQFDGRRIFLLHFPRNVSQSLLSTTPTRAIWPEIRRMRRNAQSVALAVLASTKKQPETPKSRTRSQQKHTLPTLRSPQP
jgi:hypothetical protein